MADILKVDGTAMPAPAELQMSYRPVGRKDTNAAGNTVMDRLALKRDVEAHWNYLDHDNMRVLAAAVNANNVMSLTVYNAQANKNETFNALAASFTYHSGRYNGTSPIYYENITIKFEER